MKRLALFQNSPVFGDVPANLEAARAALAGVRADLLVLPELFATGYQFTSREEAAALAEPVPGGPTTAALEALARETGATVVAGLAERGPEGAVYNAAAIVYPSGFLTTYRKLHLFADEPRWFAPGDRPPPVIRTPQGLRLGVMICFDWRFPEVARALAIEGADVIAHPSDLVGPSCPDAMITRALENHVYAATANRVGTEARGGGPPLRFIGRSQVVSPTGDRIAVLDGEKPGLIQVALDPSLARAKRVLGTGDLLAARRSDLLPLGIRRGAGPRRYAIGYHVTPEAGAHHDLLLERDGVLLAWRIAEDPGAALLAPGRRLERNFDHRLRYLDFEGDLGGGRGAVRIVERGTWQALAEGPAALVVAIGERPPLRIALADAERDEWRVAAVLA